MKYKTDIKIVGVKLLTACKSWSWIQKFARVLIASTIDLVDMLEVKSI